MSKKFFRFSKIKIPISIQISIFLVIIAFIPVVVMMALKTYEKQQLAMLESSNVQQARIVASSLSSFGVNNQNAKKILENMNGQFVSRIRVLNSDGELIADSALWNENEPQTSAVQENVIKSRDDETYSVSETNAGEENSTRKYAEETFVYKLFSFPVRVMRKLLGRPTLYQTADFYSEKKVYDGEEIKAALNGTYGAVTRISSGAQRSVTLYSAVPVFDENEKVCGVVLVSRSTYRILRNIYELRRDLAVIFLKSLAAVFVIAVFFAFRISRPLKKLSRQATDCADKKGRIIFTKFTGSKRIDEIGDLSRSFSSLIERLNKKIKFSQAFSSDISHEFKNPLTVIRSSAELLNDPDLSKEDRDEICKAVISEVNHLQMLLTGVRNISKIDAGEELECEPILVVPFVENIISRVQKKYSNVKDVDFIFEKNISDEFALKIPEDYFDRAAENLIDNAASFGSKVKITVECKNSSGIKNGIISNTTADRNNYFSLIVEDNGKGINPDSIEKIFDRFYSERDDSVKTSHTGLGLSTVKAIADSLEGEILVGKSESLGGAKFEMRINCWSALSRAM